MKTACALSSQHHFKAWRTDRVTWCDLFGQNDSSSKRVSHHRSLTFKSTPMYQTISPKCSLTESRMLASILYIEHGALSAISQTPIYQRYENREKAKKRERKRETTNRDREIEKNKKTEQTGKTARASAEKHEATLGGNAVGKRRQEKFKKKQEALSCKQTTLTHKNWDRTVASEMKLKHMKGTGSREHEMG